MKTIKMKDSGIEWIGQIPEEVSLGRIKFLVSFIKGKIPKETNTDGIGLPYIGASEMAGKKYKLYTTDDIPQCCPSDILVLWDGAKAGLVATNLTGVVSSTVVRLSALNDFVNPKYLFYLLKYSENYFQDRVNGTTIPHMSFDYIDDIPFINFRVSIQQKIANFLDVKCAEIDKLIANQQEQIDKLKEYKQSVITEAVTKGLDPTVPMKDSGIEWIGQIPQGWVMTRIKNICTLNPTQNKCDSSIDIVSYLPMECVKNGYIINREIDVKSVPTGLTWFIENDIIMAKVTPCFENGNIAIAQGLTNKIGCGSSELFVFRPKEVVGKFLLYLLQNRIFTEHAKSTMNGTGGLKRVSPSFVKNFPFALPSTETQQQIADYLDDKCGKIDQLIAIKQQKIDKLQQHKKSLIYEYVTGKKEII